MYTSDNDIDASYHQTCVLWIAFPLLGNPETLRFRQEIAGFTWMSRLIEVEDASTHPRRHISAHITQGHNDTVGHVPWAAMTGAQLKEINKIVCHPNHCLKQQKSDWCHAFCLYMPFLITGNSDCFLGKIISKSHQSQFRSIKNPQNHLITTFTSICGYIDIYWYIYIILLSKNNNGFS